MDAFPDLLVIEVLFDNSAFSLVLGKISTVPALLMCHMKKAKSIWDRYVC